VSVPAGTAGTVLPVIESTVERGRLRFFAEAIGETDPVYRDLDAARAAGHPDLPVPPTFLFGLRLEAPDPFSWMTDLGVDMRYVLHGTQRFDYERMAYAGDTLQVAPVIADVYEKRGGALEFLVVASTITRGAETIATVTETVVVRHPEKEAAA
jgi:hypothetical protein